MAKEIERRHPVRNTVVVVVFGVIGFFLVTKYKKIARELGL